MSASVSLRMRDIEKELRTAWLGRPTAVVERVDSTNRWMKEHFLGGQARHGSAVWADAQTEGRGRLGRTWDSPPGGNIYTSVLLEPPRERLSGVLSLVAGVAVVRAVRAVTGLDARMKWPNDAVVGGRKFCGILVEAGTEPSPWVVAGIGINVSAAVDPSYEHATSLELETGHSLSRETLWLQLMRELESAYDTWIGAGDAWAAEAWTGLNATLGHMVRVTRPGREPWMGMAERIDPDGGLWVAGPDRREKVISGEVSLRLADGRYAPESR